MKIKVMNEINTYPQGGEAAEIVVIRSHWNDQDMVHLVIGKKDIVVLGRDLITSVENAMRTGGG